MVDRGGPIKLQSRLVAGMRLRVLDQIAQKARDHLQAGSAEYAGAEGNFAGRERL